VHCHVALQQHLVQHGWKCRPLRRGASGHGPGRCCGLQHGQGPAERSPSPQTSYIQQSTLKTLCHSQRIGTCQRPAKGHPRRPPDQRPGGAPQQHGPGPRARGPPGRTSSWDTREEKHSSTLATAPNCSPASAAASLRASASTPAGPGPGPGRRPGPSASVPSRSYQETLPARLARLLRVAAAAAEQLGAGLQVGT
jgi:hypothetical protein